jgi:hypothetical protein
MWTRPHYRIPDIPCAECIYFICDIISTDEDPGFTDRELSVINLRGVSTNKSIIILINNIIYVFLIAENNLWDVSQDNF